MNNVRCGKVSSDSSPRRSMTPPLSIIEDSYRKQAGLRGLRFRVWLGLMVLDIEKLKIGKHRWYEILCHHWCNFKDNLFNLLAFDYDNFPIRKDLVYVLIVQFVQELAIMQLPTKKSPEYNKSLEAGKTLKLKISSYRSPVNQLFHR